MYVSNRTKLSQTKPGFGDFQTNLLFASMKIVLDLRIEILLVVFLF